MPLTLRRPHRRRSGGAAAEPTEDAASDSAASSCSVEKEGHDSGTAPLSVLDQHDEEEEERRRRRLEATAERDAAVDLAADKMDHASPNPAAQSEPSRRRHARALSNDGAAPASLGHISDSLRSHGDSKSQVSVVSVGAESRVSDASSSSVGGQPRLPTVGGGTRRQRASRRNSWGAASCDAASNCGSLGYERFRDGTEQRSVTSEAEGSNSVLSHATSHASSSNGPHTAGNGLLYKLVEDDLKSSVPSEDCLRVLQLCFASLAVVFVETDVEVRKTKPGGGGRHDGHDDGHDDGGNNECPFSYTRIPSIPSGAARMLWSKLIGSECSPDDPALELDPKVRYDALGNLVRDFSLSEDDVMGFFDAMDAWDAERMVGGGDGKDHGQGKQQRQQQQRGKKKGRQERLVADEEPPPPPRGRSRMSQSASVAPPVETVPRSSKNENPDRGAGSWLHKSLGIGRTPQANTDTDDDPKRTTRSQPPAWLRNPFHRDEPNREKSSSNSVVREAPPQDAGGQPPSSRRSRSAGRHHPRPRQSVTSLASLGGSVESHGPRGARRVPFLAFVRDSLRNAGLIDATGRLTDEDDDDDDWDDDSVSSDATDGGDASLASDASMRAGDRPDFAGWEERKKKERLRRRRRTRKTQYFQIQRDMQHQYGVHLSGLPIAKGGFAALDVDDEEDVDDLERFDPEYARALRERDTMKRWNDAMADACWGKRFRARKANGRKGKLSRPNSYGSLGQLGDIALALDTSGHSLGWGDDADAGAGGNGALLTRSRSRDSILTALTDDNDGGEPWTFNTKRDPLDDATRYAFRMLPSHLLRAGRVVETSELLLDPKFFLGRCKALDAEEACLRHRDNVEEMRRRVDLANEGDYDLGGDGDLVDAKEVFDEAFAMVVRVLTEEYSSIRAVKPQGDAGGRSETKSGAKGKENAGGADNENGGKPSAPEVPTPREKVKGERKRGEIGRALHGVAWYLGKNSRSSAAVDCYRQSLRYKIASLGPCNVSVAGTRHNTGNLHLERGEYQEAIECYEGALEIERAKLGDEHIKVANTLNSMGMVYGMTCRYDKAIECYEEAILVEKAKLGDDNLQVAESLNSLGIIQGMTGDYAKAVGCYEESLRIKALKLGPAHEEVADTLFNLGIVHNKLGDHEAAVDSYQDALRARKAQLGDDHVEVARVLHCLGLVLNDMGELENSIRCYEESLRIRLLKLGDDHEDVARTLHNLGSAYHKSGDYERAMECFRGTLRVSKAKHGSKDLKIADTLHSMGLVCQKRGNFKSAMECYHEALKVRRDRLGNDHLDVASTLHNLGDVQYMNNSLDRAMECYEGAFRIRYFKLGTDHIDVAATRNNMGVVHLKKRENAKAMECFTEALRVRRLLLDPTHEKCGDTLHNMGLVHKNLVQYDDAIDRYAEALAIRKSNLSGDGNSVKVADTLYNMAIVYANCGKYSMALERYKEALRTYRETGLGDEHPSVANTLQWIKWAQKQMK